MLILPIPPRPDWRAPPWMTLLLIFLCTLVFIMQGKDVQHEIAAENFYLKNHLFEIEIAAYQKFLLSAEQTPDRSKFLKAKETNKLPPAIQHRAMESDRAFMQQLEQNKVITPSDPVFPNWQRLRQQYQKQLDRIFTRKFSYKAQAPSLVTAFSHMFLHADLMHLLGNMAILFLVGYTVEKALGSFLFLMLYLLGGLASLTPEILGFGNSFGYNLGASGAISSIMAAYLMLFGKRPIHFFYWIFVAMGTVRWPAFVILPVWVGNELLQKFVLNPDSHVNYLAHFFGFIAGILLLGLYRWQRQGKSADSIEAADQDEKLGQHLAKIDYYVAKLQFAQAASLFGDLLNTFPHLPTEQLMAGLRIAELAHHTALTQAIQKRLKTRVRQ